MAGASNISDMRFELIGAKQFALRIDRAELCSLPFDFTFQLPSVCSRPSAVGD